jgi:hypothetical protein
LLQVPDHSYRLWVTAAFNNRAKEMDVPLLKLALFLDPRYRQAAIKVSAGSTAGTSGSSDGSSGGNSMFVDSTTQGLAALKVEAGTLAQKLGYSKDEVSELYTLMQDYAYNRPPFNKQDLTPSTYWVAVLGASMDAAAVRTSTTATGSRRPGLLANIAIKMLELKPTATSIEQVRGTTMHTAGCLTSCVVV